VDRPEEEGDLVAGDLLGEFVFGSGQPINEMLHDEENGTRREDD
jgi:hypothetical protein